MSVEQKSPIVFAFHLSDGTRIDIRHAHPLTLEEAHRESCRWAERLEVILPFGEMFGGAGSASGPPNV